mmetsp:Transcript_23123/g.76049  ORF Transcript_23123/g.76049 Transcript_23123/m.76049 type:complete len:232 (-) Transcript_23123:890-1585(-)
MAATRSFCRAFASGDRRLLTTSSLPPRARRQLDAPFEPAVLAPIGVLRSPYPDRFGCPRQAVCASAVEGEGALVGEQQATVELRGDWHLEAAVRDLEGFERIWLITLLHRSRGWRPVVSPPRGGRRGVLATRSPDRPTPLGLSSVRLLSVQHLTLRVRGVDLLDGTPVLDIKPYVPYCDSFPQAAAGWVDSLPPEEGGAGAADFQGLRLNRQQEERLRQARTGEEEERERG